MIFDILKNASLYYGLGERMKAGLQWLENADPNALEPGRYDILGDDCYALVMTYDTKLPEQASWEAHRRYIDIQYIASGAERMGYANLAALATTVPYDESKDAELLKGVGDFVTAGAGTFVVFQPEDAHMPSVAVDSPAPVKKAVVKVLV